MNKQYSRQGAGMGDHYTPEEDHILLRIAREALEAATSGSAPAAPDLDSLPAALREPRACFVTLHMLDGELRGCTGVLIARQPLALEVSQVAVQTAFNDPRFPPLRSAELPQVHVEISVLTPPTELCYRTTGEIPHLLRPNIDGVILIVGQRRATFLPQVWDRAPDPVDFLDLLCHKMGLPAGAWRTPGTQVFIYQSIIIQEKVSWPGGS